MGVSMAISFSKILPTVKTVHNNAEERRADEMKYNHQWRQVLWKVSVRSLKLFCIGMFLANGYEYTTWRIPGVLQYFAVAYFLNGLIILFNFRRSQSLVHAIEERERGDSLEVFEDRPEEMPWREYLQSLYRPSAWSMVLTGYRYEYLCIAMLLVVYLIITQGVAAPGCPVGYHGPGGISEESEYYDCTGGIHRYLDYKIFSYPLLYHHPTCLSLYQCRPYDPEGFLGVFTATTLTYFGILAGE